jgi:hypothetical protein
LVLAQPRGYISCILVGLAESMHTLAGDIVQRLKSIGYSGVESNGSNLG